jgi:hypothetical protein
MGGALVFTSFFNSPGKKNDAGETLVPVLMPLHPAPTRTIAAGIATNKKFQCNFTVVSIN